MNKKRIIIILITLLIITFFLYYYWFSLYNGNINLIINDIEINNISDTYYFEEMPEKVTIKNINNKPILINNKRINKNSIINIDIDDYKKNIIIKTRYKSINISLVPKDFPDYELSGKTNEGIYYIISATQLQVSDFYIYDVDYKGKLLYYKKIYKNVANYRKEKVNDKIRYTYLEYDRYDEETKTSIYDYVVLDENHNEIDRLHFDDINGVDPHKVIFIDDYHYIYSIYESVYVDDFPKEIYGKTHMKVHNEIVVEVDHGKELWRFNSKDYNYLYNHYNPSFVISSNISSDYYANYMHFNSMAIDPKDNNLLVSFRNICEIIKIDRSNGKIIWIMGGKGDQFNMKEDDKFLFQHDISFVDDNTISLYNNGNGETNSKLTTIKYDEKNMKILDIKSVELDAITTNWGFVEHLYDDVYLVNYGLNTKNLNNRIDEIDINSGKTIFSIDFKNKPTYFSYKYIGD